MNLGPETLVPYLLVDAPHGSAMIARTYGEPLFHAETDVAALAFAADGTLWSIEESGILRQWSPEGRVLSRSFLSDLETLWTFGPDATMAASGSDTILIWDVATGSILLTIEAPSWVSALAFSPDGKRIASGHENGMVCLWDLASGQPLAKVAGHPVQVSALAFRPDGSQLASASEDRQIRIWGLPDLSALHLLNGHTDRVPALAWHPTEPYLVSAGWDTTARLWRPPLIEPLMLLNSHSEQVLTLAFSPDGLLAVADSDYAIHIWNDPANARVLHVLQGHEDEIRTLTFSKDGKYLASAGADALIRVWDARAGRLISGTPQHHRNHVAITPKHVVTSGGPRAAIYPIDGSVALPDFVAGETVALAASPDGRWLATTHHHANVTIWDLATLQVHRRCEHTRGPIQAPCFSPDSTLLATASASDGLIWVWRLDQEEAILVIPLAAESSTLEAITFHPNNRWVACGGIDFLSTTGNDGAVCIWDLETRDVAFGPFAGGVRDLAFDPTGKLLAGASLRQSVLIWEIESQKLLMELAPFPDDVLAVAFSPDGQWLVSSCRDATLRIWNLLSKRLHIARQFDTIVESLVFSPDGLWLFTGNQNSTAHQLDFKRLIED